MKFIDDGSNIEIKEKHRLDTNNFTLVSENNFRFTDEDMAIGSQTAKNMYLITEENGQQAEMQVGSNSYFQ